MKTEPIWAAIRRSFLTLIVLLLVGATIVGSGDSGARMAFVLTRLRKIDDQVRDPVRRAQFAINAGGVIANTYRELFDSLVALSGRDGGKAAELHFDGITLPTRTSYHLDTSRADVLARSTDLISDVSAHMSAVPAPEAALRHLRDSAATWCIRCIVRFAGSGSEYDSTRQRRGYVSFVLTGADYKQKQVNIVADPPWPVVEEDRERVIRSMLRYDSLPPRLPNNATDLAAYVSWNFTSSAFAYNAPEVWSEISLLPFAEAVNALRVRVEGELSDATVIGVPVGSRVLAWIWPTAVLVVLLSLQAHLSEIQTRAPDDLNEFHAFIPFYSGPRGAIAALTALGIAPAALLVAHGRWVSERYEWGLIPAGLLAVSWTVVVLGVATAGYLTICVLRFRNRNRSRAVSQSFE